MKSTVPGTESWSDPLPLPKGLPPVQKFDLELLPDAFRPWIEDIATRMQCPVDYPAVGAMVAIASVVGRQVGIHPKRHDDWTVTPNVWGAVIGRPAMMKSPAIAEPMKMLEQLENTAREQYAAEMGEFKAASMLQKEEAKVVKTKIASSLKNDDKQEAEKLAHQAVADSTLKEPTRCRYVTNSGTVEKIGEILADNPRGILVFRDELTGWLKSLDREGYEGSRAFYLEGWNGTGRFTHDTISRGTLEVEALTLSILGGIQPGPLSSYLAQALGSGAGDDGLLQRLQLIVWPDTPSTWCNIDCQPNTQARNVAWEVFRRLDRIDPHAMGAKQRNDGGIPALRFCDEAQLLFDQWRTDLEHRLRSDDMHPALEAHLAKYRSLAPSLALLCHLIDNPQGGAVSEASTLRALAWCEYLESHAQRLYSQALSPEVVSAIQLDRHIKRGDVDMVFKARDIYRKHWRSLDKDGTKAALNYLVDLDRLKAETADGPGRPTTVYRVNPLILEE
ncbi:hypothetical protein A3196_15485 [Candidatus Thiodiazotropha endoloripes]|uniref:DUF3987 domain-containing protein n=2 Tax=Candidatus Thiodiazotropha endoloripes TaxID=1818881 RepID=A0A1E2UVT6_9GAMM|nr:hypothetical protein A3196_15485 [Candidatus Thiodiazotropha endoloripes]